MIFISLSSQALLKPRYSCAICLGIAFCFLESDSLCNGVLRLNLQAKITDSYFPKLELEKL